MDKNFYATNLHAKPNNEPVTMKKSIQSLLKVYIIFLAIFFLEIKSVSAGNLHRFYSDKYNGHFYTASIAERDTVSRDKAWRYEGLAYSVSGSDDTIPVYRFWSEVYKHHFFTASQSERDYLITHDQNWNYEGEVFHVASEGVPIHRFYSEVFKGHFYTASSIEKEQVERNDANWRYEGIAWYASPSLGEAPPTIAQVNEGIERKAHTFKAINPHAYPGAEHIIHDTSSENQTLSEGADAVDKEIWEIIKDLAPSDTVLKSITEFEVYYDPASGFDASVQSVGGKLEQWRMSINYAALENFSTFPELIIHEYAHLITYQKDQITTILDDLNVEENCQTYFDDGFCFVDGSYIDSFYSHYWENTNADIGRSRTTGETRDYYSMHKDDFISQYATTNVEEDFAETLGAFVFGEGYTEGDINTQKINALYTFDDLVLYKQKARLAAKKW